MLFYKTKLPLVQGIVTIFNTKFNNFQFRNCIIKQIQTKLKKTKLNK